MDWRIRWGIIILGSYVLLAVIGDMIVSADDSASRAEFTRLLDARSSIADSIIHDPARISGTDFQADPKYIAADKAVTESMTRSRLKPSEFVGIAWKGGVALSLAYAVGIAVFMRPKDS
jgi:hypothetical protein